MSHISHGTTRRISRRGFMLFSQLAGRERDMRRVCRIIFVRATDLITSWAHIGRSA